MTQKLFYFNKIPIHAESIKQLHPRRHVYRLELKLNQDLCGLPTVVILKKMKEDWESEFQQEIDVYKKFKSLQGSVIPIFFGQATLDDSPAIIISEVIGMNLLDFARSMVPISEAELRCKLEKPMKAIHSLGAEYLDQRLDNFILCDTGEIMVVDLEQVDFPPKLDDWKKGVNYGGVGSLLYLFYQLRERKMLYASGQCTPMERWLYTWELINLQAD
ncbi:hypothetical protein N7540_004617 [Penicillium herquei]|nr:hypothetical protein N7540_004617 [Penicillium herquei]